MRLASRDICDDETWANTVLNRSTCSVQERLDMIDGNDWDFANNKHGGRRRLVFAAQDMVRVFEVPEPESDGESDGDWTSRSNDLDWGQDSAVIEMEAW